MRKPIAFLFAVGLTISVAITVGCGKPSLKTTHASSSQGIGASPAITSTFIIAASPTVDTVLEAATRKADALDPHAVKVLDTAVSASAAHAKQKPIGPHVQQGRVIAFKGDFPEVGFPGADGSIHQPFVFFTYQSDGQLTGWAFVDAQTAAKWGVRP